MKRPIAVGLATVALGVAAPATYHITSSAADSSSAQQKSSIDPAVRADIVRAARYREGAVAFADWVEGAQMVRYAEAANFFEYLEAVEAARQAAIAAAQAAEASYSGGGGGGSLASIRACESGGNYSAVSSSGTYRGAYQFDQQTWESVGGTGDPAAAPPAEQDARAQMLYDRSGSSPWPNCG